MSLRGSRLLGDQHAQVRFRADFHAAHGRLRNGFLGARLGLLPQRLNAYVRRGRGRLDASLSLRSALTVQPEDQHGRYRQ